MDLVFSDACRFEFFQAVRLLERAFPDKIPVAEGSNPEKEPVEFKSKIRLDFPASDIESVAKAGDIDQAAAMLVNFLALAGINGPMPPTYAELVLARALEKDTALGEFLDIFSHRLVSLMYRIRKIHRIGFDWRSPEKSPVSEYLFSLMGLGTSGLKDRMQLPDRSLLYYTGLFAQQPHSMTGLEFILTDYFNVPIKGDQLKGRWRHIEQDQLTRIGVSGINNKVGSNAVVGNRIWTQQSVFHLLVGPLDLAQFEDFLPVGTAFVPFCQITRFYVGQELDFEVLLILKPTQVPESRLGFEKGPRLGWTSWLKTKPYAQKRGEVRLSPRLLQT